MFSKNLVPSKSCDSPVLSLLLMSYLPFLFMNGSTDGKTKRMKPIKMAGVESLTALESNQTGLNAMLITALKS